MSRYVPARTLLIGLVCATALSGCLTQRVKPTPSPAVMQARAREGARPAACPADGLASVSPIEIGFGFGEAGLGDVAQQGIAKAAAWLKCNAGVEVVIKPAADNHGTAAQQQALADARAKAVLDRLRALGAQSVVHILAPGAADPLTAPHLVIEARGRGW